MSHPAAYLLTWTCYGTWLHGDHRGSIDRHHRNFGEQTLAPDSKRRIQVRRSLRWPPVTLSINECAIVERAIRESCDFHDWSLHALNVRTNHVHLVISGGEHADQIMRKLKDRSTRALRNAGHYAGRTIWTDHGSTRYLWQPCDLNPAIAYVLEGQDVPP